MLGSMVQGVAFRREDESPVLEWAHPTRRCRYMSPTMKLIGCHNREAETNGGGGERLHQQRRRGRKQKNSDGEGNRGEAVVARDLEKVVPCHGERIGMMFAEGCDQGGTQDRRARIEKTICEPVHGAREQVGQQVAGENANRDGDPGTGPRKHRGDVKHREQPGEGTERDRAAIEACEPSRTLLDRHQWGEFSLGLFGVSELGSRCATPAGCLRVAIFGVCHVSRRVPSASVSMVVAAMTIVAIVTTRAVTSLVTKMSVPAGMIRMTSQASPDRQGMPAAVTVPMLHPTRVPRVRLATAVMLPHAAVAVAIPELGQLIARGEGRNQRDGQEHDRWAQRGALPRAQRMVDDGLFKLNSLLGVSPYLGIDPLTRSYSANWSYPSLLAAFAFDIWQDLAGGKSIRHCKRTNCRRVFVASNSKKVYCSDRCRRTGEKARQRREKAKRSKEK